MNYNSSFIQFECYISHQFWLSWILLCSISNNFDENYDFTRHKIDFAAAVISSSMNHVTSNRILYKNELKKYIKVDIYGGMGKPWCPIKFRDKNKNASNINNNHPNEGICKEIIYHLYKFYFAYAWYHLGFRTLLKLVALNGSSRHKRNHFRMESNINWKLLFFDLIWLFADLIRYQK